MKDFQKDIQWLSNRELFDLTVRAGEQYIGTDEYEAYYEELERRLSGFFDMPLEFYLRELDGTIKPNLDGIFGGFECRAFSRVFIGKTALEAAKAAYEWKNQQK